MPNVMATLPNIGGALCSTPQCRAVTLPRRETRGNLQGYLKLANGSQPLVGRIKFTILWGHVGETLLFNKFFPIVDTCLSCEDIARQSCVMVPRWWIFGDFCVLHFQRATCSTFQTCILNSHYRATPLCRSMVDIQSATTEIRRGKKEEEEETGQKYIIV